jgi:CelD/BcsL family acetyltransferase involved in cellulose biosynthesis
VGPGAEEPAVAAALARHLDTLARSGTDVLLPDIPADSALAQQLTLHWSGHLSQTAYATVPLPVDYSSLSRSTRRDHQRRKRVWHDLHEHGHRVTYHRTQSTTELLETYPVLTRLQRLRWPDQPDQPDQPDTITTESRDRHRQLPTVLERCGPAAFLATLAVDDHICAAQLCLRRGHHVYSLLPAMDPAHRDHAPGHALLRHLTTDLATAGYRALDLGRTSPDPGQHAYKSQYGAVWTHALTASTHLLLNGTGEFSSARNSGSSVAQ